MPLSIVSEIGSIKEALDKEPIPGLFGKDLSFFATEPTLLYLPGTDRIIYLNDRFTEVLGYTEQDLAVWQFSMVSLFPSNEWEAFRSLVDEKPSTEDKPASFHLRCKDGKELSCRLFCRLLYKDCWLVQLQDLPDRTTEELDRLSRELDEFAYVASHDLQEPLRKITTFIQRLQQKLKENTDEDVAMYIKRIQVSADNMRNLIDNLLEFSRAGRTR
jgi:PAS domain S-box-containing protein